MSFKTRSFCLKFTTALSFMLICLTASSQYNFGTVDGFLQANQKNFGGDLALMILKDDKIIYQKAMGEEFNLKTRVSMAASSQWLTAALVMTFVDEGKLSSLKPMVKRILPYASALPIQPASQTIQDPSGSSWIKRSLNHWKKK